jgi:hypothetical protein
MAGKLDIECCIPPGRASFLFARDPGAILTEHVYDIRRLLVKVVDKSYYGVRRVRHAALLARARSRLRR